MNFQNELVRIEINNKFVNSEINLLLRCVVNLISVIIKSKEDIQRACCRDVTQYLAEIGLKLCLFNSLNNAVFEDEAYDKIDIGKELGITFLDEEPKKEA